MLPQRSLVCLSFAAILASSAMSDSAHAQLPWRGHYVRRDGLFHVERAHWGGGITANGASVLSTGITAFAPVVGSLIGRDAAVEDTSKDRDVPRAVLGEEYEVEAQRARELLDRTARLVGISSYPNPTPEQPVGDGRGDPAAPQFGTSSPWKPRPGSSDSNGGSAAGNGGTPAKPDFGNSSPWKTHP